MWGPEGQSRKRSVKGAEWQGEGRVQAAEQCRRESLKREERNSSTGVTGPQLTLQGKGLSTEVLEN